MVHIYYLESYGHISFLAVFLTFWYHAVLYHPSSGWICHTPRQDPSHSEDDVTQYMQHGFLQPTSSSSLSITVYLCPSSLLPSELTTHRQSIPSADPQKAW